MKLHRKDDLPEAIAYLQSASAKLKKIHDGDYGDLKGTIDNARREVYQAYDITGRLTEPLDYFERIKDHKTVVFHLDPTGERGRNR